MPNAKSSRLTSTSTGPTKRSSPHASVKYATIDEAIQLIKSAGPGCFLAKTDVKNAFRIIPIHPDDYGLLGMQWRGLYYYD